MKSFSNTIIGVVTIGQLHYRLAALPIGNVPKMKASLKNSKMLTIELRYHPHTQVVDVVAGISGAKKPFMQFAVGTAEQLDGFIARLNNVSVMLAPEQEFLAKQLGGTIKNLPKMKTCPWADAIICLNLDKRLRA